MLDDLDLNGETVWHVAAHYGTLKDIPEHLFTEEAFNQRDAMGHTVWHIAAYSKTLKTIPSKIFSHNALNQVTSDGNSVWHQVAVSNTLDHLPSHLITADLFQMTNKKGDLLFNDVNSRFINNCLNVRKKLSIFLDNNPSLEKDTEFRDPRLVLTEARHDRLIFHFDGSKERIVLKDDGVFIQKTNYKTLQKAVSFIESINSAVEQSIHLPTSPKTEIDLFTL